MNTVLSIAGSDSCGGAGIQADLKACRAMSTHCFTAITAITAQNPHGVSAVKYIGDDMLEAQLRAILSDFRPDAVKIGMMPCESAVEITAHILTEYNLRNIVIDPVLSATSGSSLTGGSAAESGRTMNALTGKLFRLATLVTPNLPELWRLTGGACNGDIELAVEYLRSEFRCDSVLVKGGHSENPSECIDTLYFEDNKFEFSAPRISTTHTHGTGCALSSAIAAALARGMALPAAVAAAKKLISDSIARAEASPLTDRNSPIQI